MTKMPKALSVGLAATDILFTLYWAVMVLALPGWISLPPEMMYGDYRNPRVAAWNWSFLPLDLAFAFFGFLALRAARRDDPAWRIYAVVSLVLTMTAGGMAVAYWTLLGEFDPAWYLPNLLLLVWPVIFLPRLLSPPPPPAPSAGHP